MPLVNAENQNQKVKYSKHNSKANARFIGSVCKWGALAILAFVAVTAIPAMATNHQAAALAMIGMTIPLGLSRRGPLMDFDGRSGGGKTAEERFFSEMLASVKDIKRGQSDFESRMENVTLAMAGHQPNWRRSMAAQAISKLQNDEVRNLSFNLMIRELFRSVTQIRDAGAVVGKRLQRALGTGTSPGSSYVSEGILEQVYDALAMYGAWSTLDVIPVQKGSYKVPVKTARPLAAWIDEGTQIPDDENADGSAPTLYIKTAAALVNVSRQLLEDAEVDLTQNVMLDLMESISERLDWSFFRADGTDDTTDGGFSGIFHSGTPAVAADGGTTVEALDYTDFVRCLTTVKPAVLNRSARWWIHPTILARICAIKDLAGRSIFLPAGDLPSPGAIGSILGYPVSLGFIAPSTNTASQPVAAFGDPKAYAVGLRQDISVEASEQAKWDTFQVSFRGVVRAGGVMRDAECFSILKTSAV